MRQADPQLRSTLATAPDAIDEANTAFSGIRPSFPALAASLANLGRVGVIYHKSIEQLLVVLPALFAAITTAANGAPQDEGAKLDFKLDLNDPPPCSVGFLPPPLMRTPADETLRELPRDLYCKAAQNDPTTVRGARNYPCQEFPGKRAPTISSVVTRRVMFRLAATLARPAGPIQHTRDQRAEYTAAQPLSIYPAGCRAGSGHSHRRATPARCGARARAATESSAGVQRAAAQRPTTAAGQPVVDAAGGSAGAATAPVSEMASPTGAAGRDYSSAGGPGTGEALGASTRSARPAAGQWLGLRDL